MKLTKEHLESLIETVDYQLFGDTMTLCFITLKCNFVVTGKSACLDPSKFDPDIGANIAFKNAFDQLWELEGYHAKRCAAEA